MESGREGTDWLPLYREHAWSSYKRRPIKVTCGTVAIKKQTKKEERSGRYIFLLAPYIMPPLLKLWVVTHNGLLLGCYLLCQCWWVTAGCCEGGGKGVGSEAPIVRDSVVLVGRAGSVC